MAILISRRAGGRFEPRSMVVRMVGGRRIGCGRQIWIAVGAGKTSEIVIEGVVLFDDDHHVLNLSPRLGCWRRRGRRRRLALRGGGRLAIRYRLPHPEASLWADLHKSP